MKESFESPNYTGLKQEIEVLKKRVEDLESGQARPKAAGRAVLWNGLLARRALTLPAVILGPLVALGVLNAHSQDALYISPNGNVGIGTGTPGFPLTFPDSVGDKISLWGQNGAHFGFGIDHGKLQIYTNGTGSDIVFGYGSSGASPTLSVADPKVFHETMRIKGDGKVGIGTGTPGFPLTFPDSVGDKISLWGQSGANFGFGIQGSLLQIHTNTAASDIAFGYGESDPGKFTETMRIKGNGNVGIGTQTPGFPLSFPSTLGDKISLWGQSGANFGFGIQGSLLQIHTNTAASDIAFGYGESDPGKFTETMRINGSGIVTVGGRLFVQGERSGTAGITKNAFIGADNKWQIKDATKKAFTMELRDSGMLELYGTQKDGQTDWRKLASFDGPNNKVEFGELVGNNPSNTSVIVQGKLYARGGLDFYWGPRNRWYSIVHGGGGNGEGGGAISVNNSDGPSDLRLKSDLQPIPFALAKISRLRGVTFHWNEQGLQYLTRDITSTVSGGPGASEEENRKAQEEERNTEYKEFSAVSVGVVAQDVEAVLPEAVTTDESGYKSVKYYELIPLLIQALKEEDKIGQEQARTIARQQAEIQRLTAASQAAQQQLNELQGVKDKLANLEAAVNKLEVSGVSRKHKELISSNQGVAGDHSSGSE